MGCGCAITIKIQTIIIFNFYIARVIQKGVIQQGLYKKGLYKKGYTKRLVISSIIKNAHVSHPLLHQKCHKNSFEPV
jgi:hypothetical protein